MTVRSSLAVCLAILTGFTGCGIFTAGPAPVQTTSSVLRVNPANPRYFSDGSGKTIYLAGNDGWPFQDGSGITLSTQAYLDFLAGRHINLSRFWTWEHTRWSSFGADQLINPMPFKRTGPGTALDGQLKFDLNQFDQTYFDRLRSAVIAARDRGIYVSVMLFQGWSLNVESDGNNPWFGHYFNRNNNINNIDGDVNGDGNGFEVHTLANSSVTAVQDAYVRKTIETLNDLDNVLWEISNESPDGSKDWQYHMINLIKAHEATKPKQHPVGMTATDSDNSILFASPADWVALGAATYDSVSDPYVINPPATDGGKVVILDMDHIGFSIFRDDGNLGMDWAWKSFTRGYNPRDIAYVPGIIDSTSGNGWDMVTRAVGQTTIYGNKMNMADMTPRTTLCSTAYCLANPGSEYIVYQPISGESFTVKLMAGTYTYEWFNPSSGTIVSTGAVTSTEGKRLFSAPFIGDAVLYLKKLAHYTFLDH